MNSKDDLDEASRGSKEASSVQIPSKEPPAQEIVETPEQETVNTPLQDSVEGTQQETVEAQEEEIVSILQENIESPVQDNTESTSSEHSESSEKENIQSLVTVNAVPSAKVSTATNTEESTDSTLSTNIEPVASRGIDHDGMKRAAAKKLIERYFYQLTDGCGNPNCGNRYCASSGEIMNLTPNEAAALAIQLFTQEARLCETSPNKVPRTGTPTPSPGSQTSVFGCSSNSKVGIPSSTTECSSSGGDVISTGSKATSSSSKMGEIPQGSRPSFAKGEDSGSSYNSNPNPIHYKAKPAKMLTEESLAELCSTWETSPVLLVRALGEVFSQPSCLARCFPAKRSSSTSNKPPEDATEKEAWRSREKDPDKDEDLVADPPLDIESCRRGFEHLKKVPMHVYSPALVTALNTLSENISSDLTIFSSRTNINDVINCFLIAFEVPYMGSGDYLESALPALCEAAENLSVKGQAKLARKWATYCKDNLLLILESLQQLITIRVMSTNYTREYFVQDDPRVTTVTKLMKIVYYANLLAGVMEPSSLREDDITIQGQFDPLGDALDHLNPYSSSKHARQAQSDDPLALKLKINVLDSRRPHIPFEEFYNETLSDNIEMDKDFAYYKTDTPMYYKKTRKFSFMRHSFILTPATKSLGLYYDNRIRMYSERRVSLLHAVVGVSPPMPYLRLKVRRQHLIDDALIELEMVAMERVLDLKKQLVVEFEGEQGVDEGGVSKEFFQLIVEEIFNPDYGMFTHQPDTHTMWFNPTSFETEAQFTLIGIVLGLAIYNNVILAVNFPMVVYRKLLGKKGSFEDLSDWNPSLYSGLKNMLEYVGDDMQDVFIQTFRICYQDVFGNNIFHELKENGDQIFVTQENKQEFVDLYADFLLNKSVESQFKAFRRGFITVTEESPLSLLFRPEEIEQLVCGSKNFDFNELEVATEYDGGYTSESQTIKDFWSIVHSLSLEDKRKLLQFATGSDRVPVGGLIRLKLVIARNGPDSDRLPTAHTCFNVLLLPEYESKAKLNDRLLKAINYAKGFGML